MALTIAFPRRNKSSLAINVLVKLQDFEKTYNLGLLDLNDTILLILLRSIVLVASIIRHTN